MPIKKKKKKIAKKLSVLKKPKIDLRADAAKMDLEKYAGQGTEYFNKRFATKVNVFDKARAVGNFKELERFVEEFTPGLNAAGIAWITADYAKKHWNVIKILKDPEYHGAVFELLSWIDKRKTGAKAAFNNRALTRFSMLTGYQKPKEITTFQGHITMFKNYFGLKRNKKRVPLFKDKEFKI
tara:strand:+ start:26 stop:571 length:546 start_codon:yes stop_codon:yes gene_type:complete